jgi:hypothetical protein
MTNHITTIFITNLDGLVITARYNREFFIRVTESKIVHASIMSYNLEIKKEKKGVKKKTINHKKEENKPTSNLWRMAFPPRKPYSCIMCLEYATPVG